MTNKKKSKNTRIREQAASGSGTKEVLSPKERILRSPMPVTPKDRGWAETHKRAEKLGAPGYNTPLTPAQKVAQAEGLRKHLKNLANTLRKKPFGRWTVQETEEAKKYFPPALVQAIRESYENSKRKK